MAARTLFRWGDTLCDVLPEIFNVGCVSDVREKSILEQANMLGLFIAYNSYKYEIIDNTMYVKGGDGGCSLCGGDGAIYVLPCYTAFTASQSRNMIIHCPTITFVIVGSFVCRDRKRRDSHMARKIAFLI